MLKNIFKASYRFLSILFSAGPSVLGIRKGYERPAYRVSDKIDGIEIRRYESRVAAEISGVESANEGFLALFGYISGQNRSEEKVAMTIPVQMGAAGSKIAMTAPVESRSSAEGLCMRFFLPASFTFESAPKPADARIKIIALPEETMAVVRYSGSPTEPRFRDQSEKLLQRLRGSFWRPVSEPGFWAYDPPFTIPFLRRNEVFVKVSAQE